MFKARQVTYSGAFAALRGDNDRKGVKPECWEHHTKQICFLLITGGDKPHDLLLEILGLLLKGTLVKCWRYFCAATLSILSFNGSVVALGINTLCSFGPVWLTTREAGKPGVSISTEGGKTVIYILNFAGEKKNERFCERQFHLHHCGSLNCCWSPGWCWGLQEQQGCLTLPGVGALF